MKYRRCARCCRERTVYTALHVILVRPTFRSAEYISKIKI